MRRAADTALPCLLTWQLESVTARLWGPQACRSLCAFAQPSGATRPTCHRCAAPPSSQRLRAEGASGGQQYVGVLWQFLRMRQACNHPLLVKGATHGHALAAAEVRPAAPGCVCWEAGWLGAAV